LVLASADALFYHHRAAEGETTRMRVGSGTWTGGCLLAALATAGAVRGETVDQVAAEVNGEAIMLSTVLREVKEAVDRLPATLAPAERRRRADELVLGRLYERIRDAALYQAADRELNETEKKGADRRTAERMKEIERETGGRAPLVEKLRAEGRTIDHLRTEVRRATLMATYVNARTWSGLAISRRQALEYYERHRSEFSRPERRTWRVLMLDRERFGTAEAMRSRAEEVKRALAGGADFAALVRQYSQGLRAADGGLWGPMARSEFAIQPVVDAAFQLPAGQVSDLIEAPRALYLVKVEAIEPAIDASFEAAQDAIVRKLTDEELLRRRRELYDRLEQRAVIRVYFHGSAGQQADDR
jgi:parvulin-like peptidyl-prolyl isomerase